MTCYDDYSFLLLSGTKVTDKLVGMGNRGQSQERYCDIPEIWTQRNSIDAEKSFACNREIIEIWIYKGSKLFEANICSNIKSSSLRVDKK